MIRAYALVLTITICLAALLVTLSGCGGLPPTKERTGAIIVFAAFDGPEADADTIRAVALVVIGGVSGQFNGPSEQELILRNIPFGDNDPPRQPMTVTAPGYKTVSQQLDLRRDLATFVDLTMEQVDLTQTGTVSATVKASDGSPIVNGLVTFLPDSGTAEDAIAGFTDSAGKVRVGGIPTGATTVEAVAAGFLPQTQNITVQPDVGGTNADLAFSLFSGQTAVTVRGVVVDLRLETPLRGAVVTVGEAAPVTTGADGRFEVPGILVGAQQIVITLAGYDAYDNEINVLPGMGDVKVALSKSSGDPPGTPYTIGGTVTLLGAVDNSGAVVRAFDRDRLMQMATYTTGDDGRYLLFVPAGRYEISVTAGGKTISRNVTYSGGGRVIDGIDFTLSVGGS